jgi:DNA-binding HxlR family transcriptional regulator
MLSDMPKRRPYGDRCGIARALDRVGERWSLMIVRELILGPKRFTDLRAGLPLIGADVLSQRLRELEETGVLHQRRLPPPAAINVYELTPRGRELEPVLLALGRWGSAEPVDAEAETFGPDSAMLALKTMFTARHADGLEAEYQLRISGQPFRAAVASGEFELQRGEAVTPLLELVTDPGTLAAIVWHGVALEHAIDDGSLALSGAIADAERFVGLFRPT